MSRRKRDDELNVGSDSFLDVICNIVGILIILLVVAGLRVSKLPPPKLAMAIPPTVITAPLPVEDEAPPLLEWIVPTDEEINDPPPEYLAEVQTLQEELLRLQEEEIAAEATREVFSTEVQRNQSELAVAEQSLAAQTALVGVQQRRIGKINLEVRARQEQLAKLREQLADVEKQGPPVKKLAHRLMPLSRAVNGPELHFQLKGGKVALIPLQELIDRLLKQAERQKEWLAKYRAHQGSVGPVGGFTMNYVIERVAVGAATQMQEGPGIFRVQVSSFQVVPEPNLRAETADVALKTGSEFHVALQSAKAGTALTFWVYPDSYELYRRLQAAAHASGFTVAARPLPHGAPIAGSPEGSRSAGQ